MSKKLKILSLVVFALALTALPALAQDAAPAELAKPLKDWLTLWMERPPRELTNPHRFNLEEFYNRVAARSEVGYPAAIKHSQAVIQVLREAVSRGELRDVLRELPDEYDELLSGQPRGPASPSIVRQP